MKLNFSNEEYELLEFNFHIDNSYQTPINILELLIKTDEVDYIKERLNDSFFVETDEYTYVFTDFTVEECYLINNDLLLVVCIK